MLYVDLPKNPQSEFLNRSDNTAALVKLPPAVSEESIMHMTSRMKACARCRRQKVQDCLGPRTIEIC
ncbi:Vegetative incompatibility protein HET-E-1 [Fusarium oxysporum f. sp. albedinis]|nr:Vegetative incompatibility protein HET-E-1 [Fusarium oxysporum f. sp. albedinis]